MIPYFYVAFSLNHEHRFRKEKQLLKKVKLIPFSVYHYFTQQNINILGGGAFYPGQYLNNFGIVSLGNVIYQQ